MVVLRCRPAALAGGKVRAETSDAPARAGIHGWKDWFRFFWGEMTHTVDAFTIDEPAATLERSGPVLATARRDGAMEFFDLGRQARLLKIPGPTERSPGTAGHDKAPTALTFDGSGLTRRAAVQGEKCSSGSCRRIAPPGGSSTPRGRCLQCRACAGAANRRFLGHAASERAGILEVTHGEPRRTPRGRS